MDSLDQKMKRDAQESMLSRPPEQRRQWQLYFLILFGGGVMIFALYIFVGLMRQNRMDSRFTPQRPINLDEPAQPSDGGQPLETLREPSLRVAIAPVISPEKSFRVYKKFVDYIAEKLDRAPVFLQRESYAKVNDLVRSDRCDVAFVCTYAFVRGEREFGMKVLAVPEIGGVVTYHSLILVPKSSQATELPDLRGKSFASADIMSNSGWLYPATWLKDHGEDANTFFREHVITGSHDQSIMAVASGFVDGAAVDSLVYDQMVDEDPSIAQETKIILKSPPFGMPPIVVPREIDPALKQQLLAVLLDMHADPEGRKILTSLRISRFVVPDDSLFDSVRESSKAWEER